MTERANREKRTAAEAGWRQSRYNVGARVPGTDKVAIANLYAGTFAEYSPVEVFLLSSLDQVGENHPLLARLADRGLVVNFDEREALHLFGRFASAGGDEVALTLCPTMGCNFDCPYCFENHAGGKMSREVQDDVVALAGRLMDVSRARKLHVTWFGGEPLLAVDIVCDLTARLQEVAAEHGAAYDASISTNGYLLTQEVADLLGACGVVRAQITLDGMGATHDATRHLAGGGPTFDVIARNLRTVGLPFQVKLRNNVHEGNFADADALDAFARSLAEESGNDISYFPTLVIGNDRACERDEATETLAHERAVEVALRRDSRNFLRRRGHVCGANSLWAVCVNDKGELTKCWETVDAPWALFGHAHDWDPARPIETAKDPAALMAFMNAANPTGDAECDECVWLPQCAGGCPKHRILGERHNMCPPYKDDPEAYVLALHERLVARRSAAAGAKTDAAATE